MANLYNVSALTYEAKREPRWFSKAILEGTTIAEGYVNVFADIKNGEKLNLMAVGENLLQKNDGACGWNAQQLVTLSEKSLIPSQYKINLEQCLEAFRHTYIADLMAPGAELKAIPDDLATYTMDKIAQETSKEIDNLIWNGTQAGGHFDGYFALAGAQGSGAVGIQATTLTASNVVGEIGKVYAAIPETAFVRENLKIFVGKQTLRLIKMAAAAVDTQVVYPYLRFEDGKVFYLDVEIVGLNAIPNNKMFCTYKENLAFGTDLVSDFAKVEMQPGAFPHNDIIYVKGNMALGCQILFPADVVLYA